MAVASTVGLVQVAVVRTVPWMVERGREDKAGQ